jgi:YidC/Oxa1 family membrane protein insertase
MEKRVILAMLLSLVVLVTYQILIGPPPAPQQPPAPAQDAAASPVSQGDKAATKPATPAASTPAAPTAAPVVSASPVALVVGDTAARDIVVDADAFVATFTSAGATLKSWRLKQYLHNGEPLELVAPDAPPGLYPAPFTIQTDIPEQTKVLASALYRPSTERLTLGSSPGTLRFQYQDASGLASQKTFLFQPNGHPFEVTVEASVDAGGAPKPVAISGGVGIGVFDAAAGSAVTPPRVVQFRDQSVERIAATSLQQPTHEGAIHFAGVEDHYFLIAAVPRGAATRVDYGAVQGTGRTLIGFTVRPKMEGSPSSTVTVPFYLGPKELDRLVEVDPPLMNAIDFGMFGWLVRPLLRSLKWINQYVHNYGWSIILLTVVINVLIFPLRHKSMVSMRRMQTLQPQVKAIQDRYKSLKFTDPDRQKMNSEMMALYKQHGVNPASGCVPMLLTLPILFAFYAMLSVAIELRGAPFGGWIDDLAAKDPKYITPIIMGATMFWQQRMMPTTADPVQQRVFLFLPLIFTFMFLTMPSGLVLYWTASNLLAIAQQTVTNRLIAAPAKPARLPRKAQP